MKTISVSKCHYIFQLIFAGFPGLNTIYVFKRIIRILGVCRFQNSCVNDSSLFSSRSDTVLLTITSFAYNEQEFTNPAYRTHFSRSIKVHLIVSFCVLKTAVFDVIAIDNKSGRLYTCHFLYLCSQKMVAFLVSKDYQIGRIDLLNHALWQTNESNHSWIAFNNWLRLETFLTFPIFRNKDCNSINRSSFPSFFIIYFWLL